MNKKYKFMLYFYKLFLKILKFEVVFFLFLYFDFFNQFLNLLEKFCYIFKTHLKKKNFDMINCLLFIFQFF